MQAADSSAFGFGCASIVSFSSTTQALLLSEAVSEATLAARLGYRRRSRGRGHLGSSNLVL